MKVGVIAVQGAVPEHVKTVRNVITKIGAEGDCVPIRSPEELETVDAVIIPGGESTTISKLITRFELYDKIVELATAAKIPIMGTCAGCILLAKKEDPPEGTKDVKLIGLMDMAVKRNAFGRQRGSFEQKVMIKSFEEPYQAVFIRAPLITGVWGKCKALAVLDDNNPENTVVVARQDNLLATAFHPELTEDTRIHEYFLGMI